MKPLAVSITAVALAGCASVSTLRSSAPRLEYASAKPSTALEYCLAGSFDWIGSPSIVHGEGVTEMGWGRGFGDTFLLVSLRPAAGGTSIRVQEQDKPNGKVRQSLQSCL